MALPSLDDYFPDWKRREEKAEAMIPIIGKLYRKNVVTYCYGRALYNQSVTDIMRTHRFVRQVAKNELSEDESYPLLCALEELDLGPSHIDVGLLTVKYMEMQENGHAVPTEMEFAQQECGEVIGRHTKPLGRPQDIVLYGFGRIGRLLARLLIEKTGGGDQLRLRAIVVRPSTDDDLEKTCQFAASRFSPRTVQRHHTCGSGKPMHHREWKRREDDLRQFTIGN